MTVQSRFIPTFSLIGATLLWASSFIALKIAFRGYDPMVVIFGRMAVASVCFALFWKHFVRAPWRREDVKPILLMALCEPCLYFIFEAKAVQYTTASQAGVITSTLPLFVAAGAAVFLGERVRAKTVAGFFLAILGACWLSAGSESSADAPNPALGNFYEMLAMVCAMGYTIALKKLTERYSALVLTGLQAFIGAPFFLVFLFLPSTPLPQGSISALFSGALLTPTVAVLYLGTFVTMGAYGLYNFAVSRLPASQAAAFINLIPVFTIFFGWLVLNETFTASQYAATLVIFAGVYLSQERGGSRKADSPDASSPATESA